MRKLQCCLAQSAVLMILVSAPGFAVSPNIVLSQIYGGGGNSGATLKNDFIELFNRSSTAVNVTGWSVQYASTSGTTWQVTILSGTIPAGGYYLVEEAQGAGGTTNLPTPDAIGTIPMSATSGKVALVNSSTALTGSCPLASTVDLVGYGTANCFETNNVGANMTNVWSASRAGEGCQDTDSNKVDFPGAAPPVPRNSQTPVHLCQTVAVSARLWGQVKVLYR